MLSAESKQSDHSIDINEKKRTNNAEGYNIKPHCKVDYDRTQFPEILSILLQIPTSKNRCHVKTYDHLVFH
jgi:hypothetical protein